MYICLYFYAYIGDSLEYSNGYKFTTKDQYNDGYSSVHKHIEGRGGIIIVTVVT
jgi:hypothetical protein